jgi:hypothetical protein
MAGVGRIDFDDATPIDEEEDEEALAAIDEGIRDAEAGRTVPIEEVRGLLPKWITASSSRTERYATSCGETLHLCPTVPPDRACRATPGCTPKVSRATFYRALSM